MAADTDILILGGGCAGLSLATALARQAPALRVRVLESRQAYTRDRTWCFWNTEPHPFAAGITYRWASWRVRHAGVSVLRRSSRYTYDYLPADRFYGLATDALHAAGHALTMGVAVRSVQAQDSGVAVETDAGLLHSRLVFDSRPQPAEVAAPVLLQRFLGWHIETSQPCFDAATVELMDFQPFTVMGRTTFFYVLPFSATEALVEATFLDDPALPMAQAELLLKHYLAGITSGSYRILYTETGALPMGSCAAEPPANTHARVIDIGTRGGRVKPSSGYAFLRIQRQSARLAQALAMGKQLPATVEPRIYRMLDATFLRALRRHPERTPTYLMALFERLPADTLVRFLSETAAPSEILGAMASLPKIDFVAAALKPAPHAVRRLSAQ